MNRLTPLGESYHRKHETNTVLRIYSRIENRCEVLVFSHNKVGFYS